MKPGLTATLLLALALPAGAQTRPVDEASVPRMPLAEFKRALEAGKIVAVDVRGDPVYALGHIPGSISIALGRIEQHASRLKAEKRPIVAYCAWTAEHTSARAALRLVELGVKDARALQGGYTAWVRAGYPVAKAAAAAKP